jgi:hypothetical protein
MIPRVLQIRFTLPLHCIEIVVFQLFDGFKCGVPITRAGRGCRQWFFWNGHAFMVR